ncbi:hypothetical protein ATCC90586_010870 [Pythium insidiosum]|nr:hypothetical protein ATCC90586_010870 [Pythium insidiosum]
MSVSSSPRVVVVGGGIIGLTSALALLQSGYSRVHLVAESFDELTSHVAGAIWMPFALPTHVDPHQTRQWCEESMAWLERLWQQHGEAVGIHYVDGVDVSAGGLPDVTHPYWAHIVKNYRLLSREEAAAVCPGMTHGSAFTTVIYNPTTLMKWLHQEIRARGGTFEQRKLSSLDDVDADLVVNCTGLGAKDLVSDDTVYPIRGQVLRVHNPAIKRFTMVVHRDGSHTYILPRPAGEVIVGGTVQPHNWTRANDPQDVEGIWARACAVEPLIAESRKLAEHWGLRPQRRDGVRLEVDSRRTAKGATVVHNYGHVGSGHTLQWGCAQSVVRLAKLHVPPVESRL